ncbi:hypothetical protein [Parasitella parasitica]|uniref:Uncharacterized protein n=1 Tax=Parasitella parasitica TaxID=35722 RepID=A0A0B7NFF4_9FUNG|nr:hypothetical protein [Parasitella parasitica]
MSAALLYDKAFRSYLLTKYTHAANTCLKAIAALDSNDEPSTRLNIWTLYLNITSTLLVGTPFLGVNMKLLGIQPVNSMEQACLSIWKKVTEEGYQGVGNTDARLVSACVVMNMELEQLAVARSIAEDWFASVPDDIMDHISVNREQGQMAEGYIRVVELYAARILPRMHDFESANTFLEYNSVLTDSKKKGLKLMIQQEQELVEMEKQKKIQIEKELEEKRREEERLLMEEAKRIEQEKEKAHAAAASAAMAEKPNQENSELTATPRSVASQPLSQKQKQQQQKQQKTVQKWIKNITTKSAATSGALLILIFALLALLRGQRGRLSIALQSLMNKLWQTVKMGTKVTYM